MSIKEMFVDYYELLSLFRCQRVDSLKKALDKNGIEYMEDTAGRPIVLRTSLPNGDNNGARENGDSSPAFSHQEANS